MYAKYKFSELRILINSDNGYARTSANWVVVKLRALQAIPGNNAHTSANWVGVKHVRTPSQQLGMHELVQVG